MNIRNTWYNLKYFFVLLIAIFVIIIINISIKTDYPIYLYIVFGFNLFFIFGKYIFSYLYARKYEKLKQDYDLSKIQDSVDVIIPCYNEDIEVIKTLFDNLSNQNYEINNIIFVDDCSTDERPFEYVSQLRLEFKFNIIVHRLSANCGKLNALLWGIEHATSKYVLLLDADGYITTDTIINMMAAMYYDDKVSGVCGQVLALNKDENFLTKMQNILYFNAFHLGRQHQSFFNRVLVCSGAISMYRREVLECNLKHLKYTKLWHKERLTGDDIALTNIVISQGFKTVYVQDGKCYTSVPITFKDFFNQQTRWAKDAYFCFFEEFTSILKNPIFFLLQLQEVFFWLIELIAFVFFVFHQNASFPLQTICLIAIFNITVYVMCNFYVIEEKASNIFMIFIYDCIYQVMLIFIRLFALISIGKIKWKKHSTQLNR